MKKVRTTAPFANGNKERLRRRIEAISTVGLLLIAAGLMAPFANGAVVLTFFIT